MKEQTETVLVSTMGGQQKTVPAFWKGDRFSVTQATVDWEIFVITHNKTGISLNAGFSGINQSLDFMISVAKEMDSSEILREIDDQVPALKDQYELSNFQESHPEKIDRWLNECREIYLRIKE